MRVMWTLHGVDFVRNADSSVQVVYGLYAVRSRAFLQFLEEATDDEVSVLTQHTSAAQVTAFERDATAHMPEKYTARMHYVVHRLHRMYQALPTARTCGVTDGKGCANQCFMFTTQHEAGACVFVVPICAMHFRREMTRVLGTALRAPSSSDETTDDDSTDAMDDVHAARLVAVGEGDSRTASFRCVLQCDDMDAAVRLIYPTLGDSVQRSRWVYFLDKLAMQFTLDPQYAGRVDAILSKLQEMDAEVFLRAHDPVEK